VVKVATRAEMAMGTGRRIRKTMVEAVAVATESRPEVA
jgi:hypothetical protein